MEILDKLITLQTSNQPLRFRQTNIYEYFDPKVEQVKQLHVPPIQITPTWKRQTTFSAGYANAIPLLESIMTAFSALMTPQLQPTILLLAMAVPVSMLPTIIAQSAICINHLNYTIITTARLTFHVNTAVLLNTIAKETPFQTTGPGPPPPSINDSNGNIDRAITQENAQQFRKLSSSCVHHAYLCSHPSSSSQHPPVSNTADSEAVAAAVCNPVAANTTEIPKNNIIFEGGRICPPNKLVT